jgi:hypothetical protein
MLEWSGFLLPLIIGILALIRGKPKFTAVFVVVQWILGTAFSIGIVFIAGIIDPSQVALLTTRIILMDVFIAFVGTIIPVIAWYILEQEYWK